MLTFPHGYLKGETGAAGPIAYVASSTYSASTIGTGNVTINKPTGTASGDLVMLFSTNRNALLALPTGGTTWAENFSWSVDSSSVNDGVSTNDMSYCWSKTAGSSEPSQYTVAYTDQGTDGLCMICVTFRNASVVGVDDASDDSDAPSITASEGDTLISWHGSVFEQSTESAVAAPTDMTLIDKLYTSSADVGIALAYEIGQSAGATGVKTWTTEWTNWSIAGNVVIRWGS